MILLQKKVKRKINYKSIIIVLVVIVILVLMFFLYRSLRVRTIYVTGNKLLTENEILEKTNLLEYPRLVDISNNVIIKELKKNKLINNVKITKSLTGKVVIEISENKVLYQDINGKYMLSNKEEVTLNDTYLGIPILINSCDAVKDKFIEKLLLVNDDILKHISEIEYKPTDLDKERFMFYMSDTNYVYVTLSKMNLVNSYNEIYPTLEGKKGILYLDSGNHFEIKKSE